VVTAGSGILGHVLTPAGFTLQVTSTGHSSGGTFVAGRFSKGSRYLEFHFRHSLGLVIYGWGDATLSMRLPAGVGRNWRLRWLQR
jgi:hypothetical protein